MGTSERRYIGEAIVSEALGAESEERSLANMAKSQKEYRSDRQIIDSLLNEGKFKVNKPYVLVDDSKLRFAEIIGISGVSIVLRFLKPINVRERKFQPDGTSPEQFGMKSDFFQQILKQEADEQAKAAKKNKK